MANPIKASDLYQDDGAIERAIKQLGELQKAVDGLRKESANLTVQVKKQNSTTSAGREEIAKTAKQADELSRLYKKYNDSLTKNAREVAAVREAQKKLNQINRAEARLNLAKEGSYNALSAQYSLLKLRLNQMTRAERDNTAEGRKMVKQAKETYEEMKRLQEETGKTALNVGNYKESIKEALQETGLFPGALGQVAQQLSAVRNALQASTAAITGSTKALRFFKIALAATGIGAIVLVLGSLIAMLTRTQKGIDFINRLMAGFKAVADVFIDRLSAIGEALRNDFSGTMKEAGNSIKGFFSAILSRDYASFIAQTAAATSAVKDLANEVKDEFNAATELAGQMQAVNRETQELEVRTARARAEIKRLNLIAEDTTRGYADRAEAARAAGAIERQLLAERESLLQRELSILEKQKALGESLFEDDQELADKRREIAQVRTESLELQTTINNKLNIINAEAARVQKKLNDELKDAAAIREGAAAVAERAYEKEIEAIEALEAQSRLLGENKIFSDARIIAAARYQQELDKILLTTKRLAQEGLQPLASSAADAGDRMDEVRTIATENSGLSKGLKVTKEGAEALQGAFNQAKAQVGEFFQQQVQLANFQVQQAQQGVQAAQNELQIQLQLAEAGYANRVETAQAELELARRTQEEAEKQRQKAQRAQLLAQSVEQASNLVTAVSKLFADLPFFLALPATGVLFGTFAAAKIKAFQATKFGEGGYEMLDGGSHASGRDIPLYVGKDGKQRRAEGGESMAIFSRRAVARYGGMLPGLVEAINRGEFERRYAAMAGATDALSGGNTVVNVNTRGVENRLDALRRDNRERTYTDGQGRTVRQIGNRKITYV